MVAVISGTELHEHQVDGGVGRGNEDHLHARVVEGDEIGEEIKVPGGEDQCKHDLSLAGDTCT